MTLKDGRYYPYLKDEVKANVKLLVQGQRATKYSNWLFGSHFLSETNTSQN